MKKIFFFHFERNSNKETYNFDFTQCANFTKIQSCDSSYFEMKIVEFETKDEIR